MGNRANNDMFIQHLFRNPFCSRPVDPLPAALSGSREDICFLHPSSLIHKATSVSLHSALSRFSSAVSAEATQACSGSLGQCGYYYGGGDGMSSISMLRLCIMFNSRMVHTSPQHCGYNQQCTARKWLCVCDDTPIHPHSPSLQVSESAINLC